MKETIKLFICIVSVIGVYFFSFQIQMFASVIVKKVSKRLGTFSVTREYAIQRYVFLHRNSPITKFYNWINEQLIASGLKRVGVTPIGYVTFWAFMSAVTSFGLFVILNIDLVSLLFTTIVLFAVFMVMTRVLVAERMERREADVMDAIDLIIPEVGGGVKNAIMMYLDNFSPALQGDFNAFVTNVQDRGYSFSDAMFILADNLGTIFKDFAQKAVYFEGLGEPDMLDIFADIIETNRLRRELRYVNASKFTKLKASFIASAGITAAYFIFIISTDEFSRTFFLKSDAGRLLLMVILLVVFGVLSYLTTIKSRAL